MVMRNIGGRVLVKCAIVLVVAMALAAARWAMAIQSGGRLDACRVKQDYETAKRAADQAARALEKIKTPPEAKTGSPIRDIAIVQQSIELLLSSRARHGQDEPEYRYFDGQIKWRQSWLAAVQKTTETKSRVDDLQELYDRVTTEKNAALQKARADIDAVGNRFNQEKDRLQGQPHTDYYLRQSQQLIARTRAALFVIRIDLAHFECWDDVKSLVADIDEKVKRLEAALKNSANRTATPRTPATPPTSGGDLWIADEPTIQDTRNRGVTASATSIVATTEENGKRGTSTMTWSGIPKQVKVGERVVLRMRAQGSPPGRIGGWFNFNNCTGKMYQNDGQVDTIEIQKPSGRPHGEALVEFDFAPGSNPYIQISGGADSNGRWALITWKYHKASR